MDEASPYMFSPPDGEQFFNEYIGLYPRTSTSHARAVTSYPTDDGRSLRLENHPDEFSDINGSTVSAHSSEDNFQPSRSSYSYPYTEATVATPRSENETRTISSSGSVPYSHVPLESTSPSRFLQGTGGVFQGVSGLPLPSRSTSFGSSNNSQPHFDAELPSQLSVPRPDTPWNHLRGSSAAAFVGFGEYTTNSSSIADMEPALWNEAIESGFSCDEPWRTALRYSATGDTRPSSSQNTGSSRRERTSPPRRQRCRGVQRTRAQHEVRVPRRVRSCWHCFIHKIKCDGNDPCGNCRRVFRTWPRGCDRTYFEDASGLFVPSILTDAHQLENLRDWQNDRILRWTGNHVQVHMTWGYGPKICWHQMTEVEPKGDLLHSSQWITNTERCQRIVTTSPPLGYANLESIVTKLREKANTYLREFIDGPHMDGFASFAFKDHPLQISLLQVVLQYCAHPSEENADEVRLLRAARKLLVLIYIMTHVISIFPGHKQDVFDVLQYSDLIGPQSSHVTLRLAQRQTKYVLNTLVVDLFRAILKGCEQILRRRKKGGGWAAAFCTLTILAVVSEEMQIAMIMKGQYDAEHGDSGARTKAEQQSKDLEGEGFLRLVDYFHKSFSTHSAKDKPFNPLGDRENEGVEQSLECLDDATKTLVCGRPRMLGQGGLRGIMSHFAEEMDERRRQLILEPDPARHPQANTSRLVSRWLCTFRYTLQYSA